jgi:hypothetical protein
MRQPSSSIPGLVLSEKGRSRIAFLPADVDRRYAREHLPDHGDLLANIVRWAAGDNIPVTVQGPGLIDCHLYRQGARSILHLVNLTNAATWRAPIEELIRVGPIRVSLTASPAASSARLLVSGTTASLRKSGGTVELTVPSILDHEVLVLG